MKPYFKTNLGKLYIGKAEEVLAGKLGRGSSTRYFASVHDESV